MNRNERYATIKRYGHERGLSCAFRQWRAESHCSLIHGYALAFEFRFVSSNLDSNNWVIDFGSLKPLEAWLRGMFDHTTVVAEDDPAKALYSEMQFQGLIDLRVVQSTGCESFAALAFDEGSRLARELTDGRVRLESVKVSEHNANSAICWGDA
jgi:6-pyruvoyltetrahydropterin/6-carboxytetrahydropterin synthase